MWPVEAIYGSNTTTQAARTHVPLNLTVKDEGAAQATYAIAEIPPALAVLPLHFSWRS